MVPVQEFFSYFGVYGFYGVSMTDVENMILYGEEVVNRPLPSVKDIVLSNEVKAPNDDFHDLYKNSLLSECTDCDAIDDVILFTTSLCSHFQTNWSSTTLWSSTIEPS